MSARNPNKTRTPRDASICRLYAFRSALHNCFLCPFPADRIGTPSGARITKKPLFSSNSRRDFFVIRPEQQSVGAQTAKRPPRLIPAIVPLYLTHRGKCKKFIPPCPPRPGHIGKVCVKKANISSCCLPEPTGKKFEPPCPSLEQRAGRRPGHTHAHLE